MAIRPPRAGFTVSRRMSERARAPERAAPQDDADIPGFSGFGAMVGSLRRLIEQFSETASSAQAGSAQAGSAQAGSAQQGSGPAEGARHGATHTVDLGGQGRMVFGYTLRMGPEGIAAEPFGNVHPPRPKAADEPRAQAPITDIFEDGDDIVVVAEVPGVEADRIACSVNDRTLLIETTGTRRYRKSLQLPAPSSPGTLRQSYRNGILEVRIRRAGA